MENFTFAFCMAEEKFVEKHLCASESACLHLENLKMPIDRGGFRCYECARHRLFNHLIAKLNNVLGADRVDGSLKSLILNGERSVSFPADHLELLLGRRAHAYREQEPRSEKKKILKQRGKGSWRSYFWKTKSFSTHIIKWQVYCNRGAEKQRP